MTPQSEHDQTSLLVLFLSAVLVLLLTLVPLTGASRQAPPLVTGLDHIIILVIGASVVVKELSAVRRALQASGLKPVSATSGATLLPPELTYVHLAGVPRTPLTNPVTPV